MAANPSAYVTRPLDGQAVQRLHPRATEHLDRENAVVPDLTARDLMVSVVTVRPEESVERAARLMKESECGALPVVDALGLLVGIITRGDIATRLVARSFSVPHAQVSDCMTTEAFASSADNSAQSCLRAMSWHQVRWLPIVDENHKVLGLISQKDLARYVCETAGRSEPAINEMLWALAY